jgi:hypothetical protein
MLSRSAIGSGAEEPRLPLDGASFEDGWFQSAHLKLRSSRPDVSPSCPEHGGLASFARRFDSGDPATSAEERLWGQRQVHKSVRVVA